MRKDLFNVFIIQTLNPHVCLLRKAGECVSIGVACRDWQTGA